MTIFQMKNGNVEPVAIIKAGKTTKLGRRSSGRRSRDRGAPLPRRTGSPPPRRRRPRWPRPRTHPRSKRSAPTKAASSGRRFLCASALRRTQHGRPNRPAARCVGVARLVGNPHNPRTRITAVGSRPNRGGGSGAARRTPGESRLDIFLQQVINGLTLGSVYAVVALGYTMVYGIIQLINFAHGEVVMIGAMVAFSVITALAGAPIGLPPLAILVAGVLVAIPVCMGVGYTLGARRLPAAAQGAATGAAHHGHRPVRSSCSTSR